MAKGNRDDNLDRHKITDGAKLAAMSSSFNEGKHMELEVFPAERAMLYATANHTVSLSVTNNRGTYALVFTMVDGSGRNPVTKTATIALG